VGVNVTEIEQLAPAPNVLGDNGHVEVCAKSPDVTTPPIVSGVVWLFFKVTVFPVLVELITWLAKVRLAGDRLTGAVPAPVNCVICGEFGVLSLTVTVPARAPIAMGVKVTEMVQLAFPASALGDSGQFDVWAKSPEVDIPAMVIGTV
jgi:hypothetical protein